MFYIFKDPLASFGANKLRAATARGLQYRHCCHNKGLDVKESGAAFALGASHLLILIEGSASKRLVGNHPKLARAWLPQKN